METTSSTDVLESKLDERSKEIARRELNELNDADCACAVETLRDWALQQNWLRTPTDFAFLLRFLRLKKFSQLEARKRVETYWTHRVSTPDWHQLIDPADETLQKVLGQGFLFCSPKRDKHGRRVTFVKHGVKSVQVVNEVGMDAYMKAIIMYTDWLSRDEHVQVNGLVCFEDFTGYTLQKFLGIDSNDKVPKLYSYIQNGLPARVKAVYVYNQPPFFDIVFAVISKVLSKKITSRIKLLGKNLVPFLDAVGLGCLPDEYLPDDYKGPTVGTTEHIVDEMITDMNQPDTREYIRYLSCPKHGVDKDKRPSGGMVKVASFRKLCLE